MIDFFDQIENDLLNEEDIFNDDTDIFKDVIIDQFYTCSFCHCDITDEEYDNGGICSNCANKF